MLAHEEAFKENLEVSRRDVSRLRSKKDEEHARAEKQRMWVDKAERKIIDIQAEVVRFSEGKRVAMKAAYKSGLTGSEYYCKLDRACFESPCGGIV